MNQHYSEADLLETYYTQPGESMPVMMHLADCSDCAARYERLERKIRGLAACDHEKPETFWARQRMSILRQVEKQPKTTAPAAARILRVAAAAAFVLVLGGGVWTLDRNEVAPAVPAATEATTTPAVQPATTTEVVSVPSDPWKSEELDEFGSLVAWESWDETSDGDES